MQTGGRQLLTLMNSKTLSMSNIKPARVNKDHGNAGSCKQYIDYLEKENIGKPITQREYFFNDKSDFIAAKKAEGLIDGSPKQGIRGKDAKYFEVIMSFEEKDIITSKYLAS